MRAHFVFFISALQKNLVPFVGVLSLMLVILTACGELKKVDEMKDATSEMNDTTKTLLNETKDMKTELKGMKKVTDTMSETTNELRVLTRDKLLAATCMLYDNGRQGQTDQKRDEKLQLILKRAKFEERIADAGRYMMSFEFQLIGETCSDPTDAQRLLLYQQGTSEFFHSLKGLAPDDFDVNVRARPAELTDTGSLYTNENRTNAFNALSIVLHMKNRFQKTDPAFGHPVTMYDLIISALKAEKEIAAGRMKLPEGEHYIKEVLLWKPLALQLLQTRYNMMPLVVVGSRTQFSDRSELSQGLTLINPFASLNVDLSEKTSGGVAALSKLEEQIMVPAVQTRSDLISLGITPEFTFITRRILAKVRKPQHRDPTKTSQLTATESRISELWQTMLTPVSGAEMNRQAVGQNAEPDSFGMDHPLMRDTY